MGLFDQFPYTNFHELNLDWILKALKELEYTISQFVAINALKYADPIQWNITNQYEKNTIVIDPLTGTAYISVEAVPAGVSLTNPDYWTVVFDLRAFVVRASKNFTYNWEDDTTLTATFNTPAGHWLVWGDTLYKALVNITAGDSYVVDGNIQRITVEEVIDEVKQTITDNYNLIVGYIGDLTDLSTTAKDNLVNAINELVTNIGAEAQARSDADTAIDNKIGALSDLNTTDKSSVVNAINETLDDIIAEAQNRADADNAIDNKIGALSDLNTTDKSSVVNAINEVHNLVDDVQGQLEVVVLTDYPRLEGEIDDTGRINRALAACGGSNNISAAWYKMAPAKPLIIPAGTYTISSPIFINKNNISIIGYGQYNTIIKCADNVNIDSIIKASEAYGLTIKGIQLDGACPYNNINYAYGADCCLWIDQCAYVTVRDVVLTQGRYQGLRLCHVWESYFSNLAILYAGMMGTAFGEGDSARLACGIFSSALFKISTVFPGAESNELHFDKLAVTGMYGSTVWIDQIAPIANCYFNSVIEENALFNWLSSYPAKMTMEAWHLYGTDTDVSINGHYVYEHALDAAIGKPIYTISGPTNVSIKHATIMNIVDTGKQCPYSTILTNYFNGNVDVDITVRDYFNNFTPYIVATNTLYGVTNIAKGSITYLAGQNMNETNSKTASTLVANITAGAFFGTVQISGPTGGTVYQANGATPT